MQGDYVFPPGPQLDRDQAIVAFLVARGALLPTVTDGCAALIALCGAAFTVQPSLQEPPPCSTPPPPRTGPRKPSSRPSRSPASTARWLWKPCCATCHC